MTTEEICKRLNKTRQQVRQLQIDLGIEKSNHKVKNWTKLELARMKMGKDFVNYHFVEDMERNWIFYAIGYNNEIKIEL